MLMELSGSLQHRNLGGSARLQLTLTSLRSRYSLAALDLGINRSCLWFEHSEARDIRRLNAQWNIMETLDYVLVLLLIDQVSVRGFVLQAQGYVRSYRWRYWCLGARSLICPTLPW